MSEEPRKIDVYESRRFSVALGKLPLELLEIVEDEIEKIIASPEIGERKKGERKKGDLSHLWVHKFKLNHQQVLLGYSWVENKIELYLLHMGVHENFYTNMKNKEKPI